MTLYILHGFAKAAEFGVDVPKDMVAEGLGATSRSTSATTCTLDDGDGLLLGVAHLPQLRRVVLPRPVLDGRTPSPPTERKEILDFSFRHWKQHSPYLKGYLALTLKRMGRAEGRAARLRQRHGLGEDDRGRRGPSGRRRTAPGSGTTTPSRPTPSRCAR